MLEERGQGRQRVLYFFRTPPGVRVGRVPIDDDAMRLLEAHHPVVQFDWGHLLKQVPAEPGPVSAVPAKPDGRRTGRGDRRDRDTRDTRPSQVRPAERVRVRPAEPVPEPVRPAVADQVAQRAAKDDPSADDATPYTTAPVPESYPDPPAAVLERLGPDALARLRRRFAEVIHRLSQKPMDEDARTELKQRAQRLNPDAWETADDVTAALEQYESVFEGLRAVVGRHPRRRRRGSRPEPAGPGAQV